MQPRPHLIFDLDGTLIDSAPDIQAAANAALAEAGQGEIDLPTLTSFIGRGVKVLAGRIARHLGLPEEAGPDLAQRIEAQMKHSPAGLTVPYPHVIEVLGALQAAGHRLALCTNKPEAPARLVLRDMGLEAFFDVVVGGGRLAVLKPDPAPLQLVIDELGGGPALYVGDSETDAETAERAGVPFYLFTLGYRVNPIEALLHCAAFDDWRELPGLIAQA